MAKVVLDILYVGACVSWKLLVSLVSQLGLVREKSASCMDSFKISSMILWVKKGYILCLMIIWLTLLVANLK